VTSSFAEPTCAIDPVVRAGSPVQPSIPLDTGDQTGAPGSGGHSQARVGRRVLVVEDNEDAADALRMFLELGEHTVQVAGSAPEALQMAEAWQPEIVLSDIGLPGEMDGYALARALRAVNGGSAMFLVALSGYGREQDKERARASGFDAHLTKPVDIHALEALIASGRTK
jgi:CheY-like chemotaxis protein